jgi:hypothetical protein
MIKVRLSPLILEYRQMMEQLVHETRDEKLRISAQAEMAIEYFPVRMELSAHAQAGLLTHPKIHLSMADIYLRNGETEGLIQINTSDVFGIVYIHVTLRDEAGNLLESGDAMRNETCDGHWGYMPCESIPIGTTVTIRAVALDALGGLSVAYDKFTVYEL